MPAKFWKLEGKKIVQCKDVLEWGEFFEKKERFIKNTQMPLCWISTVFLGLDHSFYFGPEERPPILFESMIFGGPLEDEMDRYSTYEEAEEGHETLCKMAEKATQDYAANIMVWIMSALLIWIIFD